MDSTCPFCDLTQIGERYIAKIGSFHVAATLGQMTDGGYILVFPVGHIPCFGAMEETMAMGLATLKSRLCALITKVYRNGWVAFEHGIFGQSIRHAHLHILPFSGRLYPRVRNDFPDAEIVRIAGPEGLSRSWHGRSEPYLYWEGSDEVPHVCWVGSTPDRKQYFRRGIAEALGRPERADWRTIDPALDRPLYLETVVRLQPYLRESCCR